MTAVQPQADGTYIGVVSDPAVDLDGCSLRGWTWAGPAVLLLDHRWDRPVGLVELSADTRLWGRLLIVDRLEHAAEARRRIAAGQLGLSVGGIGINGTPNASGGRDFESVLVTEVSLAANPKNAHARIVEKDTSIRAMVREGTVEAVREALAGLAVKRPAVGWWA